MEAFWGYLGWTVVALSGGAYVWFIVRIVLFPKQPADREARSPQRAA